MIERDGEPEGEFDVGALLAPVAAAAATGASDALARALDAAFAAGCPLTAVRETVLLLAPFGGFPRTLDALAVLRAARVRAGLRPDVASDAGPGAAPVAGGDSRGEVEARRARGRALFERVYGTDAQRVFGQLLELDAELPHWVIEDAYGRVLSRPGLSAAERECVAVIFLCALKLPNQLSGHVRGALRCGATVADVERSLVAAEGLLETHLVAEARRCLARAGGSAEDED